jgi:hemerythrin
MSKPEFMIWKPEYSVGIERIDSQHREIFETINRLYWAIQEKQQVQIVGSILAEMERYVYTHLKDEETLMQGRHYPDFEVHRASHKAFTQKTNELIMRHQGTYGDISSDVFQFLRTWWISHIIGMDQKYIPYMKIEHKNK